VAKPRVLLVGTIKALVVVTYVIISLIVGSVVHLATPVSRKATAQLLEQSLSSLFQGEVHVGEISRLLGGSVTVLNLEVYDPQDRLVISVERLDAGVDLIDIVQRVLAPYEKLSIEIKHIGASGIIVHLLRTFERDNHGTQLTHLSIQDAFSLADSSPSPSQGTSRPLRIWMPRIVLRDAQVDGSVASSPVMQTHVEQALAQLLVTDKGVLLDINRFGLRASGALGVDATARGEVHLRVPGAIYGDVSGVLGEIPMDFKFRTEERLVSVDAHFPRLEPAQVRPIVGSWPLDETLSLKLKAHGKLPQLDVDARAAILTGEQTEAFEIVADGTVQLEGEIGTDLHIVTRDLDLSKLLHTLPRSQLDSESQLQLVLAGTSPKLTAKTRLLSGNVGDHMLPPTTIDSSYAAGIFKTHASAQEPGLAFSLDLQHSEKTGVHALLDLQELASSSPYLAAYAGGVTGAVQGRVEVQTRSDGTLKASCDLNAHEVRSGSIRVENARLSTSVSGDPAVPLELVARSKVDATGLALGPVRFKTMQVEQSGQLKTPHLKISAITDNDLTLTAEADTNVKKQSAHNLKATLDGNDTQVSLEAKHVAVTNERVIADEFVIKSIGEVRGSLNLSRHGGDIDVTARGLNLSRISRHLGLAQGEMEGDLNAQARLHIAEQSTGIVEFSLLHGAYKGLVDVAAELKAEVEGSRVTATASTTVPSLGKLKSRLNAKLGGSLLYPESWRSATGTLKTDATDIDLKTISLLLGLGGKADLTGQVSLKLDVKRNPEQMPKFTLTTHTEQLGAVIEQADGMPLVIQGIDLNGVTTMDVGHSKLESTLRLTDARGELMSVSGEIQVPLLDWWEQPISSTDLTRALLDAPLNLVALVPERKITQLPTALNLPLSSGRLSARLVLTGTANSPELGLVADAKQITGTAGASLATAVNVRLNGRYAADSGSLVGNVSFETQDQSLGSVSTELLLPWAHLLNPPPPSTPLWTGSARLELEQFPLQLIQTSATQQVRGTLEGTVNLTRTGMIPEVASELRLRHLVVAGLDLGDARFELSNQGPHFTAHAQLTDDFGELTALGKMTVAELPDGLGLAPNEDLTLQLECQKYNAAAVAPFLSGVLDEVSGPLSGKLKLTLSPPSGEAPVRARLTGNMKLSGGTIRPSAIGLHMENVSFSLEARPEGDLNVVRLNNIRAHVASKTPNLTGRALVRLRNLELHSGAFQLNTERMEVSKGVTPLATVTSSTSGEMVAQDDALVLSVHVQQLLAELAEGVDDQLIDLEENPNISVIQEPRRDEDNKSSNALPVVVKIDLGKDTRIRNSLLDARLTGAPEILLGKDTAISGGIELMRGSKFVVLGRSFIVDRGLIAFGTRDFTDPQLQVGATWSAPNNVIVRLDVGGTLSAPTLAWSSEPALPGGEAEVLALVIGGGTDSSGISGASSVAMVANEITDVDGLAFYSTQQKSTGDGRVASLNDSNWDSYTASYQISDKLWFEGSYKRLTTGAAGGSRSGVSGTLDWRFHPQWSLRSEIGMLGVGLDALWQYRY